MDIATPSVQYSAERRVTMTTLPSLLSEMDPKRRKSLKKGVLEEYRKYRKANSGVFQPPSKRTSKTRKGLIFAKRSNVQHVVKERNMQLSETTRRHTYDGSNGLRAGTSVVLGIPRDGAL